MLKELSPEGALPVTFCIAAYGALQIKNTTMTPGFTRGHNRIAPTELLAD